MIHGAPVTTFDLDTLVKVDQVNADRLANALSELDAHIRECNDVLRPTREDILAGGHLLLMTRAGPLDVLGFIGERQRYEDLLGASSEFALDVGKLRVISLEELIRQKRKLNRAKDRAVADLLRAVLENRKQQD